MVFIERNQAETTCQPRPNVTVVGGQPNYKVLLVIVKDQHKIKGQIAEQIMPDILEHDEKINELRNDFNKMHLRLRLVEGYILSQKTQKKCSRVQFISKKGG